MEIGLYIMVYKFIKKDESVGSCSVLYPSFFSCREPLLVTSRRALKWMALGLPSSVVGGVNHQQKL